MGALKSFSPPSVLIENLGLYFVLLPNRAEDVCVKNESVTQNGSIISSSSQVHFKTDVYHRKASAPSGKYIVHFGALGSFTNDEWADLLEQGWMGEYRDFCNPMENYFKSALESGVSLMKKHNIFTTNPFGEKPDKYPDSTFEMRKSAEFKRWELAESRTGNWHVFKVLKQI